MLLKYRSYTIPKPRVKVGTSRSALLILRSRFLCQFIAHED
jgi:hypothetical protein